MDLRIGQTLSRFFFFLIQFLFSLNLHRVNNNIIKIQLGLNCLILQEQNISEHFGMSWYL